MGKKVVFIDAITPLTFDENVNLHLERISESVVRAIARLADEVEVYADEVVREHVEELLGREIKPPASDYRHVHGDFIIMVTKARYPLMNVEEFVYVLVIPF